MPNTYPLKAPTTELTGQICHFEPQSKGIGKAPRKVPAIAPNAGTAALSSSVPLGCQCTNTYCHLLPSSPAMAAIGATTSVESSAAQCAEPRLSVIKLIPNMTESQRNIANPIGNVRAIALIRSFTT